MTNKVRRINHYITWPDKSHLTFVRVSLTHPSMVFLKPISSIHFFLFYIRQPFILPIHKPQV